MIIYPSPIGNLIIFATQGCLMLCDWQSSPLFPAHIARLKGHISHTPTENITLRALDLYFQGKILESLSFLLENVAISPIGTPFYKKVWNSLTTTSPGQTISYSTLARLLSTHPRAVARAVAHNPVSIFLPCHRVVGIRGQLTGYAGGLDAKKFLLRHESLLKD